MNSKKALIIGSGVSGLSTGIRLGDAGYEPTIWTAEESRDTTSATAAAFWEPYLVAPEGKAAEWSAVSLKKFAKMAKIDDEIGVQKRPILSVYRTEPTIPAWASAVPDFRRVNHDQMQNIFEGTMPNDFQHGFAFETYMIEMTRYLPHLEELFSQYGSILQRKITDIREALDRANIVINCTALGSRDITGITDLSVFPVAGQVAEIRRTIEETIIIDPDEVTYIVPRSDNVILGGTAIEHRYDRTPDKDITLDIVRRCARFLPHVLSAPIQQEKMGLRPARPEVRLDSEKFPGGKTLIHNYGHGGGGVTLSWGCAEEVLSLLEKAK